MVIHLEDSSYPLDDQTDKKTKLFPKSSNEINSGKKQKKVVILLILFLLLVLPPLVYFYVTRTCKHIVTINSDIKI